MTNTVTLTDDTAAAPATKVTKAAPAPKAAKAAKAAPKASQKAAGKAAPKAGKAAGKAGKAAAGKAAPKAGKAAGKAGKAAAAPSERRARFTDDMVITLTKAGQDNPRRAGTGQHAQYELLRKHNGRTVAQFKEKGGNSPTLGYAVAGGFITVK